MSRYLKSKLPGVRIILADPQGSSLFNRVKHGVCYCNQQSEKLLKRHRYDSIVEGVGLDRITANFESALIDDALRITDQEMIDTAHWVLQNDGLFVGSSSALNIAAACKTALELGPGHTIVTVVCDNGSRHVSRFWNSEYIGKYNLNWPIAGVIPSFFANKVAQ
jgi:cysteine synthase A